MVCFDAAILEQYMQFFLEVLCSRDNLVGLSKNVNSVVLHRSGSPSCSNCSLYLDVTLKVKLKSAERLKLKLGITSNCSKT